MVLKVAPLLDNLEVKRLLVLAAEAPAEIVLGIPYEEYVNADVVFITITKKQHIVTALIRLYKRCWIRGAERAAYIFSFKI